MDNKNDLVTKILELDKEDKEDKWVEIEKLLENGLKKDPNNIDLWIRLAVLELRSPFLDKEKSIECLENVFKIEKDHPIALLLKAYILDRDFDSFDKNLTNKLSSLKTDSDKINSMLRFAASWYYKKIKDFDREEKLLRESINFYKGHVWNHMRLAALCLEKGQEQETNELVKTALKNNLKNISSMVKKIPSIENWRPDPTNVNNLLYDFFSSMQLLKRKPNNVKEIINFYGF